MSPYFEHLFQPIHHTTCFPTYPLYFNMRLSELFSSSSILTSRSRIFARGTADTVEISPIAYTTIYLPLESSDASGSVNPVRLPEWVIASIHFSSFPRLGQLWPNWVLYYFIGRQIKHTMNSYILDEQLYIRWTATYHRRSNLWLTTARLAERVAWTSARRLQIKHQNIIFLYPLCAQFHKLSSTPRPVYRQSRASPGSASLRIIPVKLVGRRSPCISDLHHWR